MVFRLPKSALDTDFPLGAKGKSTFQVLHGPFERDAFRWSQDDVKVVGHDHESVQHEFMLPPIRLQDVQEEFCAAFGLEYRSLRARSDEESSLGQVILLWIEVGGVPQRLKAHLKIELVPPD